MAVQTCNLAFGRPSQEDHKFEANLGCAIKFYFLKKSNFLWLLLWVFHVLVHLHTGGPRPYLQNLEDVGVEDIYCHDFQRAVETSGVSSSGQESVGSYCWCTYCGPGSCGVL